MQLDDSMQLHIATHTCLLQEELILAYRFNGLRYDCGSKLGYLKDTVEFALQRPKLQQPFRAYLQRFCVVKE